MNEPGGGAAPEALMSRLTSNQEQRTALQFAMYNTMMFALVAVGCAGLVALYNMLYMFLSPMLWAVLVGTVLFPFKRKVTAVMQDWLAHLQDTDTPLMVALIFAPYSILFNLSELVFNTAMSKTGGIIFASYTVLKFLSYDRTFVYIISWMGRVYQAMDTFILFFSKAWVFPLIVVYFLAYSGWIYVQETGTINKKLARSLSLPLWIYTISFLSQWFGPLRVVVFGASALVLGALSAGLIKVDADDLNGTKKDEPTSQTDTSEVEIPVDSQKLLNEVEEKLTPPAKPTVEPSAPAQCAPDQQCLDSAVTGDTFIRVIAGLCALLWMVRHDSALILLIVPFLFAVFRRIGISLGVFTAISNTVTSLWDRFFPNIKKLVDVTVAGPLRQFVKMLFTSDQFIISSLREKMDVLSSVVVMALIAIGSLLVVVFVGFQLHGETVHLVRLTSNVVSSRPDWLSTAFNYTEEQLESNDIDIDDYIEQAYQQGRSWLASNVRSLADPKDTQRADMLEMEVKKIVDNVYNLWEQRDAVKVAPTEGSVVTSNSDWMTQLKGVTDLQALKDEITHIIKDNVDTLLNIAQSLWSVVAMNISFLSGIIAAFAGLIFGFGMDIINLLIECIVFLTMVYYLLASSRDRWLPLEWASQLTGKVTSSGTSSSVTSENGQPIGDGTTSAQTYDVTAAVEQAIFGVFVLSCKMAVFYGLYTYFVHSLFDLNIVFVPSLAASVFAAIPIMAPYIVCVFGVFELYLVRGEAAAALVFALMSVSPMMFADATFYREVKYSHPYVTGLSIIGGMYWLGLQGAIIGPIILCTFLVLVNLYMHFVQNKAH